MAAWFTVYCTRSVQHVTAADLTTALGAVDFYTAAEGFGIASESAVERAVSAIRVQPVDGGLGERFEVRYRPAKYRPLVIYLWVDPARVRQELAETREEYLTGLTGRSVSRVFAALSRVVEVAAVELGLKQLEDMGLVVAGQVAESLAGVGAGLIRDTGDEWWVIRRGVPKLLLGRP